MRGNTTWTIRCTKPVVETHSINQFGLLLNPVQGAHIRIIFFHDFCIHSRKYRLMFTI